MTDLYFLDAFRKKRKKQTKAKHSKMQKRLFSVATLGDLNPHCSEAAVLICVRLFSFCFSFWGDIYCLFNGSAAAKV